MTVSQDAYLEALGRVVYRKSKVKGCPPGVSKSTLWRIKCGTEPMRFKTLLLLSDHFGVTPARLLEEAERMLL